jgi:hypothetical protein
VLFLVFTARSSTCSGSTAPPRHEPGGDHGASARFVRGHGAAGRPRPRLRGSGVEPAGPAPAATRPRQPSLFATPVAPG